MVLQKKLFVHFRTENLEKAIYFNINKIEKNVQRIIENKPMNLKVLFPVKSFPSEEIIDHLSKYVDGYDISNEAELSLILGKAKKTDIIWNSSPHFTPIDSEHDVIYDLNTPFDIEQVSRLENKIKTSLRINLVNFGIENSRFGIINIDQILHEDRDNIFAIHIHSSSISNNVDYFKNLIERSVSLCEELSLNVKFINIGGGFADLEWNEIFEIFNFMKKFEKYTFVIEPGRLLTNDCGVAVCKVKNAWDDEMGMGNIVVNLSSLGHLRWMSKITGVTHIPVGTLPFNLKSNNIKKVFGQTCSENDIIFSNEIKCESLCLDDVLVFTGVNGYCFAWNKKFNGIKEIDSYIIYNDKILKLKN